MSTKSNRPMHIIPPLAISPVVIREATAADSPALARVAQRDSSPLPAGELLVGESDGQLRAAIEVESGRAIADPFAPTAELIDLLRTRAEQIRGAHRRPLRILARTPRAETAPRTLRHAA